MIIVNDGSTDSTARIIREFVKEEPRIKFFDRKNIGIFRLAETYNFALSQSCGELIAILEGDDLWNKEKLELQVKAMNNDPEAILCWSRATSIVDQNSEAYEIHPKCENRNLDYYFNNPPGAFFNIVFDDFPPPLTFLIRKDALEKTGNFRQVTPFPAVDLPTILALSLFGRFIFIPRVLGSWRQHANQVTKNNSVDLITGSSKIIIGHYESMPEGTRRLLKFDHAYITKTFKTRRVISFARSGRFKLIRGMFNEARKDYRQAMVIGNPFTAFSWKIRALTGLLLSYFHTDVEWLARLLGKKSFK